LTIDKDVAAGLFFMAFGILGLVIGSDYVFGTTAKMGAGFVPKLLAWALVGLGAIIALTGFLHRSDNAMDTWAVGPLLVILSGVLVFGACLEPFGLEGATIGSILIASSGRAQQNRLQICLLVLAIIGLSASLYPGMGRLIGQGAILVMLAVSGLALLVHWLIYAFSETRRALIEQLVLAFVLAILAVIVFADLLGLPFKSQFVLSVWLPIKAVITPAFKAVRGLLRGI